VEATGKATRLKTIDIKPTNLPKAYHDSFKLGQTAGEHHAPAS
jgi:hypothetical protein